jgi:hypothetical protein
MSSIIEQYLQNRENEKYKYLEYGFLAFMALIFMKLLTEYATAKRNRQLRKNKMLFEATKMSMMAKMSMAASDARGRYGRGGGGGGGGSNK